jgi:small multidrug resistance pump
MTLGLLLVVLAVVSDAVATACLKASCGFTRRWAGVGAVLGYVCFLLAMGQALARLPLAVAYGVWSGLGMGLVAGLGVLCFGERLDWRRVCGLALIGAGVALANQG